MPEDDAAIVDELYADYPATRPTSARPWLTWRRVVHGALLFVQGMCIGLMAALLLDRVWPLATPLPTMVSIALIRVWVWPHWQQLTCRAITARIIACHLAALPLIWWR